TRRPCAPTCSACSSRGTSERRAPGRRGSVAAVLVDDLEDLAAEELLDDLAAVAGGDHRVLVVTGRTAGGVGVRGRIRRAAAAHTTGTLTGAAGGLRRLAHQRGAAARGRRWRSGTGARRGGS